MLSDLFKNQKTHSLAGMQDKAYVYAPYDPTRLEAQEIERAFARTFSSDDGRKVLAHLQAMTFHKALGPQTANEQLRYMEGQRAMVANILRLIDRGRRG